MTFRVGQKIVCVKDDWHGPADLPLVMLDFIKQLPRKGGVYHVRTIEIPENQRQPFIRLVEIVNPRPPEPKDEVHWNASFFRPVVETETDISIFTRMLNPSDRKVAETVE